MNPPPVPEKNRRTIVAMVLLMFWLLVFEGSLRKWAAPQFSSYLYFVRDPFVIVTYILALRAGVFAAPPPLLVAGLCIAAIGGALSLANLAAGDSQYTVVLAAYGFRNYFLYLPLPFVIARCFRLRDIGMLATSSILALVIAAPIAVLQFESDPTSVLNVGRATDAEFQFQNLASGFGKVRPAGTFTSVVGMSHLIVSTVGLLLWAWSSNRRPRPVNPWMVRLGLAAVAVALAVSGSRTSFVHAALVVAVCMAMAPFLPGMGTKFRTFALPAVAVVLFAILYPVLFPEAAQTFFARWQDAAQSEGARFQLGWFGRVLHSYYDFFRLFGQMPLGGYGIGMAGNGATNSGVMFEGRSVLHLAEEDWSRHVVELGPPMALVMIVFRLCFGIWLGAQAVRATLRSGELLPVAMYVYCAVALIQGQITGHGLVNGFGWLYVGVCMAACAAVAESIPAAPAPEAADSASAPLDLPFPNLMR